MVLLQTSELRVQVELIQRDSYPSEPCPLVITIQVSEGTRITSFDLPHRHHSVKENKTYLYYTWGKTICIDKVPQEEPIKGQVQIRVTATTCHPNNVMAKMVLTYLRNALTLNTTEDKVLYVAPTTSQFFKYDFNQELEEDMILIALEAIFNGTVKEPCKEGGSMEHCKCMTISVQNASICPVYDDPSTVRYRGFWQTFSTTAAITIQVRISS